ncbi:hypothetical protein QP866_06700 [Corynebacterium imitans]|uniref:hypothetical protein n=1 Tax=Corynebacterium imitans TaxID=156978 RepID=UPI00254EA745|nr:hypothetical protein [Corynebacterium imitans]MDK8637515.1 hypothetical protein [Corynebacterium imitans]MDK8772077.1 hypothetical protein [Corynebacterium imitans]
MARIRTVKPEFWRSPDIMSLSPFAKLLYIGLFNFSDDDGRGLFDVTSIAADVLLAEYAADPAGVTELIRDAFLAYVSRGMVTVYEVDGRAYYQINAWHDHQRINRPVPSKIPPPEQGKESTHGGLTESSMSAHGGLTEDSVTAHERIMEDSMWERKGGEGRRLTESSMSAHGGLTEDSLNPDTEKEPAPYNSLNEIAERHFRKEKAPGVYGTADDPRCADHVHLAAGNVPNCRRCASAREWFAAHEKDERARARAERRAAIDACDLCDENGKREVPGGLTRCNHQPHENGKDIPPWEHNG